MIPSRTRPLAALALFSLASGPAAAQTMGPAQREALAVAEAALAAITAEDMVALTDLIIDEGVMYSVAERNGAVTYAVRPREQERARTVTRDIVERGFDPTVLLAGRIATVWLPYDLYLDGEWSHCGVDVFTLLRLDGGWRIAALAWTVEQPPACEPHPAGPPGR